MISSKIIAGDKNDIKVGQNEWLIVDIGFSSTNLSCGVWGGGGETKVVTFGDLVELVRREFARDDAPDLNLLIEAPLSVAIQKNGNPIPRLCDRLPNRCQPRPWYVNAGATTLIAAQFLFRELHCHEVRRTVRLFEGFISFKRASEGNKTARLKEAEHIEDVLKLKNAIWTPANAEVLEPDNLTEYGNRIESSAFPFLDKHLIPPVILINSGV